MYLILRKLIECLPHFTEDGLYISSVKKSSLIESLNNGDEFDKCLVVMTIEFVENLFDSLCILDKHLLSQDIWKFKSFPAQLMARSLLSLLSDKQQKLFDQHFWSHNSTGVLTEKQRVVLKYIETNRERSHEANNPQPIRYLNAAWGFIVIDGQILFKHREDAGRADVPNYVPVGARLILNDIEGLSDDEAATVMQKNDFHNINTVLINTVKRGIEQETGLLSNTDYELNYFMTLKPFLKVEGAGASHAYTENHIAIWTLALTRNGFFKLSEKILNTKELVLFDFESITTGKRADGKSAYLDALHDSFDNRCDLLKKLGELPASFSLDFISNVNHTFPINEDFFLVGKSGKESEKVIKIDTDQINLLHTLAWHGKGLEFESLNPCLSIHLLGWIKVDDHNVLDSISELGDQLSRHGLNLIDIHADGWVKIKLSKENIFFSDELFSLNLTSNFKGDFLEITARSITSILGKTRMVKKNKKVPESFYSKLFAINNGGNHSSVGDSSLSNQMGRLDKDKIFSSIGLKQVVRIKKNNLRLFNQ
jgi:hypothetical protein